MDKAIVEKLDSLFAAYPATTYKKGHCIIDASDQPTGVLYIESGIVRQYWMSQNGEETTLNLYKPHAFLPMAWAIADVKNIHFYEALTDVTVRKAPKDVVLSFLKKEPDVVFDLLRRVYVGLEGLWLHMESLTTGNSAIKLIASLVILAKRFGEKAQDDLVIRLKLSEGDIANYAGMSRETANRELQKLRKNNLVAFEKGTISIHNLPKLEDILISSK